MHVLFSAAVIACPLQTTYCHGYDSLILDTKTVHSKEDKGKLQTWTKVGILLNFWGVLAPPLTPQTTLDACFQNFFPSLLWFKVD